MESESVLMQDRVGRKPSVIEQMEKRLSERPKLVEPDPLEPEKLELAKKSDPLPQSPSEPYRPHASFLNRLQTEQRTFHCVLKDCTYRGFPYASFDGIELTPGKHPGSGLDVVVRFSGGGGVTVVTLSGRNLRFVYHCVSLGILPWVWELPEGQSVDGDAATVIDGIRFETLER